MELKSLERRKLRDDLEHQSYQDENILGTKGDQCGPNWLQEVWSDGVFCLLGHMVSSYEGQFFTTIDAPRTFAYWSLWEKVERAKFVGDLLMP